MSTRPAAGPWPGASLATESGAVCPSDTESPDTCPRTFSSVRLSACFRPQLPCTRALFSRGNVYLTRPEGLAPTQQVL